MKSTEILNSESFTIGKDKIVYKVSNGELFQQNKKNWLKIGVAWLNNKGFDYGITEEVTKLGQVFNPEFRGHFLCENCKKI